MDFPYKKGQIEDKAAFLVGDDITTTIFNQTYGAALYADRWTQKSTNILNDPFINYYMGHNIKDVYKGESLTGLFGTETVSDDDGDNDTMYPDGATRVTSASATSGVSVGGYTSSLSLDLTQFPDGSASTDDDYILFSFVINDVTKWNYGGLRIGLDSSNYYYKYPYATAMVDGVNHFVYKKSDFNETGTPVDWSSVTYLALRFTGADSVDTTGEWYTLQAVQLIRANPDNDFPSPRQLPNGGGTLEEPFGEPLSYIVLKQSPGKTPGYARLKSDTSSETIRFNDKTVNTFYSEMLQYISYNSYSTGLGFKIDSDNYIQCYVESDTFYLQVYEAGSLVDSDSQALNTGIERFDTVKLVLEKDGDDVRAQCGDARLTASTSLTDEGYIVCNQPTVNSLGVITGWSVSNERKEAKKYPQLVWQRDYVDNTSLAETNLHTYLEPSSMYHIDARLCVQGDIAGSCLVDWDYNGDIEQVSYRCCRGLGVGESSVTAAAQRTSNHSLGTNVSYGLATANHTLMEDFVIRTGPLGGRLVMRAGSTTSTVTINGVGSYMIVNKLNT